MKKFKILLVAMLVSLSFSFANADESSAASGISIYINDVKQSYSDKAIIKNGSTLVPLRGIFEALGAGVIFDSEDRSIEVSKTTGKMWLKTASKPTDPSYSFSTKIFLKIGSKTTYVNGKKVTIAMPAQIVKGSTLVPLRFISETLGAEVRWDAKKKTIKIITPEVSKQMKAHFIDVGQGDSTLLQLATGENVLVDAGTDEAGEKVVAYLKSLGIKKLDYVIATHPDDEHIGGITHVLNAFPVGTFIDSGVTHTSQTYEDMLFAIKKKKVKYVVPKHEQILLHNNNVNSYLQILNANPDADDIDDASLVVAAGFGKSDVLLMADADSEIERKLLYFADIPGTIIKAGNHGSDISTSLDFLKSTSYPESVILSYGKDNAYGYPHKSVLGNIKAVGAKAYSTAQDGTIIATINSDSYSIDAKEFKPGDEVVEPEPPTSPNNSYKNCTELRKDFPKGVQKGHWAYQPKMDLDGDGWACES
ncbi:stalk domain-containing protein [Lysinibacillus sp. 54212]|uniref:stalk domain-containing protein n=1 Tax=Lysinibacillus sp. 54212 TaxID=3119829 RepID=UPI002FC58E26